MPTIRQHRKPEVPKEAQQAERIARQMYSSLTLKTAPKASSQGYVIGALTTLKLLFDQAVQQGADREALRQQCEQFVHDM